MRLLLALVGAAVLGAGTHLGGTPALGGLPCVTVGPTTVPPLPTIYIQQCPPPL